MKLSILIRVILSYFGTSYLLHISGTTYPETSSKHVFGPTFGKIFGYVFPYFLPKWPIIDYDVIKQTTFFLEKGKITF